MEKDLLKLFKLADKLNQKQSKVYAEIFYRAYDRKELEITIRSKKNFSFIRKFGLQLLEDAELELGIIIKLFEEFAGGVVSE